jgi:hypothetical protein
MTQFTCEGVKQINNRISLNMTFTFTIRISRQFFISAGVSNGEFPDILIAKCRSRFFCTWIFSRTEDFESWREGWKGPSTSGEKCSRRKVHMYEVALYIYVVFDTTWQITLHCFSIILKCILEFIYQRCHKQ